jgi:hypothetical protein
MTADNEGNTGQAVRTEMTTDDVRLQLAALNALKARVAAEEARVRKNLHAGMRNGESHTVWSPLDPDAQIATVNRSKPGPKASVTDRGELTAWLAEHYPEKVQTRRTVTEAGLAYLTELDDEDLLAREETVPDWAVEEVVKASEKAKEPCTPDGTLGVPGISVSRPDGALSVRLSPEAADLVTDLIASGRLDTDGTPREIER